MSDRLTDLRQAVANLLPNVDGVVALKSGPGGSLAPYLFVKEHDELAALTLWPKYPVPDTVRLIQKAYPNSKLGVVCRGCEERGLVEMSKRSQIYWDKLELIGLQCTKEEAESCRCANPTTAFAKTTVGDTTAGVADTLVDSLAAKSQAEKLAFWKDQFQRCIKCYGCRNTCAQCFCNVCTLEDGKWVETGRLPMPQPAMYHLIRAMHMAGKCVACHECEETCPSAIPMAVLYRLLARDVKELFNYETGAALDQKPPQLLVLAEGEYSRTGLPH